MVSLCIALIILIQTHYCTRSYQITCFLDYTLALYTIVLMQFSHYHTYSYLTKFSVQVLNISQAKGFIALKLRFHDQIENFLAHNCDPLVLSIHRKVPNVQTLSTYLVTASLFACSMFINHWFSHAKDDPSTPYHSTCNSML